MPVSFIQNASIAAGAGISTSKLGAGAVLQVVSTTSNASQSINTQTFTEITSLTTSITPTATTSKILILAEVRFTGLVNATDTVAHFRLRRNSTDICQGDGATGNMVNVTASAIDNHCVGT